MATEGDIVHNTRFQRNERLAKSLGSDTNAPKEESLPQEVKKGSPPTAGMARQGSNTGLTPAVAHEDVTVLTPAIAREESAAKATGNRDGLVPQSHGGALRPWKPGQSGNPGGRPKKKPLTEALERVATAKRLRQAALALLEKAANLDDRGSIEAFQVVRETLEGKLPTPLAGSDSGPLQIHVITEIVTID